MSTYRLISEQKWQILCTLWRLGEATLRELVEELWNQGVADERIDAHRIVLNRMVDEGLLTVEKSPRAHQYRPLVSESVAVDQRLVDFLSWRFPQTSLAQNLVKRFSFSAPVRNPFQSFVGQYVTPGEWRALLALWATGEQKVSISAMLEVFPRPPRDRPSPQSLYSLLRILERKGFCRSHRQASNSPRLFQSLLRRKQTLNWILRQEIMQMPNPKQGLTVLREILHSGRVEEILEEIQGAGSSSLDDTTSMGSGAEEEKEEESSVPRGLRRAVESQKASFGVRVPRELHQIAKILSREAGYPLTEIYTFGLIRALEEIADRHGLDLDNLPSEGGSARKSLY